MRAPRVSSIVCALLVLLLACANDPPVPLAPSEPHPQSHCPDGVPSRAGVAGRPATGGAPAKSDNTDTVRVGVGGTRLEPQRLPVSLAVRLDESAALGAAELLRPLVAAHVTEGANAVGKLVAGQFLEGQSLVELVTGQAGRCYTVIGMSLAPATELDLTLKPTAPTSSSRAAANDWEAGPVATIGKRPSCFEWREDSAGAMELTLTVRSGQGVAVAQVYEGRRLTYLEASEPAETSN